MGLRMDRKENLMKEMMKKLDRPNGGLTTLAFGPVTVAAGSYASVLAKAHVPEFTERRMHITLKDPLKEVKNRTLEETVRELNKVLKTTDGVRTVNMARNGEVEITFRDIDMKVRAEAHKEWVQKVFGAGTEGRAVTVTVMARGVAIKDKDKVAKSVERGSLLGEVQGQNPGAGIVQGVAKEG